MAKIPCKNHHGEFLYEEAEATEVANNKAPTCTEYGEGVFTATFPNEVYEKPVFETQTETRPILPTGHQYDAWKNLWDKTGCSKVEWADDGSKATWYSKCDVCGAWDMVDEAEPTIIPIPGQAPDCTHEGVGEYMASFWYGWYTPRGKEVMMPALGHDASAAVENAKADNADELTQFVWSDDLKSCTWKTKCSRCDEFIDVDTKEAAVVYADGKEPTCTESGTIVHRDAVDFGDGITVPEITEPTEIPALGHDWSAWTEGEDGKYTRTCRRCNETEHPAAATPSVTLSKTAYVYNGKVQKPEVTVKANGVKLAPSEYKLTYSGGCKNVGKYTVTVALKNGLEGSKTVSYKIDPAATALKSVKAGKKSFTVKWTKKTAQTTGYQIQYSESSKFKAARTKTVNSYKKSSLTVKKLKSKKKYYVRIRTYKTVKGTKFYSKWSKAKTVKTR
jgi:hypothetical protein